MQQFMLRLSEDLRTWRNQNGNVQTILAMTLVPFAMAPPLGFEYSLVLKMKEGIDAIRALDINIPSLSSVSAARAAFRHEFLSPEGKAAIASSSGDHLNFRTIDEQFAAL